MAWISLVVTVLGCASSPVEPLRSTPIPATTELGDPAGLGVKWAGLEGFVGGPVARLPTAFGALSLGQGEAEAEAALAALHDAGSPRPKVLAIGTHRMHGAVLASHPDVGVTAIVDVGTGRVSQIDASVPEDQALYAFTEAWGAPTIEADPVHGPVAVWRDPDTRTRAQLFPGSGGRGVAKFDRTP